MMGKTRAKSVITIGLAASLGGYLAFAAFRNTSLTNGFNTVSKGETVAQVVAVLGKPSLVRTACRDSPTWLGAQVQDKTCAREYQYNARILPKFWTVGFDGNRKVIAKYEYVSP
jgi:hypothetical protein